MDLYINSAGIISGAGNNMPGRFILNEHEDDAAFLPAVEPEYKAYIPVMQLRRMSRAVRMGVVAARTAMIHAGIDQPDALSVGTAYGCLQDTETFLDKMIEQEEQMLTPTAFIQSTHNTVGGQIALLSSCYGHNLTYVHRGHSFEHAMMNAQLYLNEHPGETMLVGGIDEQTPNSIKALQLAGKFSDEGLSAQSVWDGDNKSATGGEGAAFFTVTQKPTTEKHLRIKALEVFKADEDTALEKVKQFAERNNTQPDVFLSGTNGMSKYHSFYTAVKKEIYPQAAHALFKNCSGDYPVASGFALAMLLDAAQNDGIPACILNGEQLPQVQHVVMVNNFGEYYSCWLLELSV